MASSIERKDRVEVSPRQLLLLSLFPEYDVDVSIARLFGSLFPGSDPAIPSHVKQQRLGPLISRTNRRVKKVARITPGEKRGTYKIVQVSDGYTPEHLKSTNGLLDKLTARPEA